MTYLHQTSDIPLCRAQSVLQICENQKSILFFYPKLWNFENSENIKSYKHDKLIRMRKMAVKEKKKHISTLFKLSEKPQILEKSSRIM